jgi:hypothetical protein
VPPRGIDLKSGAAHLSDDPESSSDLQISQRRISGTEPFAWLKDVLRRMTDGHPSNRLDEFLPWNWQPLNAKV